MAFTYKLKISEKKLQSKLLAVMPIQKSKFFVSVSLSDPVVNLTNDNNEIGVSFHLDVLAPGGISASGLTEITGSLRYESEQGMFFLDNIKIINMQIDHVKEKYIPSIKKVVLLIGSGILSRYPVYKLQDEKLKHKLIKSVLKSVFVKNKKLHLELSAF